MRTRHATTIHFLLTGVLALCGCGTGGLPTPPGGDPAEPAFSAELFSAASDAVTNPFFPLVAESARLFQQETEDGVETVLEEVLDEPRVVAGVACVAVRVREWLGELLIEDAEDWYAQDDAGNVWYLGEAVLNYEYDDEDELVGTDTEGSWETGADVAGVGVNATAGIIMKAVPIVGDVYAQEIYPGEAEDMGEVVALAEPVVLTCGTAYTCLKTRDWNPLEPDSTEFKYYAPGVGLVMSEDELGEERVEHRGTFDLSGASLPDLDAAVFTAPTVIDHAFLPMMPGAVSTFEAETEDGLEVILVEVLGATRVVDGVVCRIVRDRVYLDGVLIEDTHDWFAQDDAGNIWYLGEEVVNYEYDDEGMLIETNDDGSWEAGVDGAEAGILMWAMPLVGPSYRQEYWEDEAEDMALVLATGVTVVLGDGTTYTGCVKTLDWTPLEPTGVEFKYYAPGVGLVLEEKPGGEERVERVAP